MSVYFYSKNEDGQIAALTGVKCIVLPNQHASQLAELKNVTSLEDFNEKIKKQLNNTTSPIYKELEEEIEHFKCLTQSYVGSYFHLRHLLCRLPFSGTYKNGIFINNLKPRAIHREIIRYFIGYTTYHKIAFPLVEGHFHSQKNTQQKPFGYPDEIWLAKDFLQNNFVSHNELGKMIDYLYINNISKSDFASYFEALSNIRAEGLSSWKKSSEFFVQFIPMLKVYNLPFHMCRVILKNLNLVSSYLKPRLFPPQSGINLANTPSIVTYKVLTDPTGFASKNAYSKSQEVRLTGNTGPKLNLLWHVLSRLATIYQKLQLQSDIESIFHEMQLIFDFMFAWKSDAEDILVHAQEIDTRIFQKAREMFNSNKIISINEIEHMALELMKYFLYTYPTLYDSKSFKEYINCSYYHI